MTIEAIMIPLVAVWLGAIVYASRRGGPLQTPAWDTVARARKYRKSNPANFLHVGYYRLHRMERTPLYGAQLDRILAQYPMLAQENLRMVNSHQHFDDSMLDVFADLDESSADFEKPIQSLSHECQVMSDLGRAIPLGGGRLALAYG